MMNRGLAVALFGGILVSAEPSFRINFGSCHDITEDAAQEGAIWDTIISRQSDAFVWGGDNVYGDENGQPATPAYLTELYERTSNIPQYRTFVENIGQVNVIGTWDDHDLGLNNAGNDYPFLEGSQEAFLDFFQVPLDDPRRSQKGVYSSKYFDNGRIKVVMLDIRYNRDTYDTPNGDFLGEEQWSWLEAELNEGLDNVKATVIMSSIQVLPESWFRLTFQEAWGRFKSCRERLFNILTTSKAPNLLLVSGDVHYAEMLLAECSYESGKGYLVPEMTASGMTHAWATNGIGSFFIYLFHFINRSPYQFKRQWNPHKNFGEIDFFLDESETSQNHVIMRTIRDTGTVLFENKFFLSELKDKDMNTQCACGPHAA